jgi:hypothetical protein
MSYCALDEAFLAPVEEIRRHRKPRPKEVPPPLPDVPTQPGKESIEQQETPPVIDPIKSKTDSFFPLPGESESWEKAFVMESDFTKTLPKPPIEGESTLWRKIPVVETPVHTTVPQTIWTDVNERLDTLTKQLESLTSTNNSQSKAELFLFVAVGLLLLLFVDTLLRYASSVKGSRQIEHVGGFRRMARDSLGRFQRFR